MQLKELNSSPNLKEMYKKLQPDITSGTTSDCIQQLETFKTQITENMNDINRTKEYVSENLEQSAQILRQIQEDQSAPTLSEEQIRILALNKKIVQTLLHDEFEQVEIVKKEDFEQVETCLKEEVDNTISAIETMEDQESIKQAVANSVKEQEYEYAHLKDNVHSNIDENSHRFAENFDSTMKHVRQNGKLRNILKEIAENRKQYKPQNDVKYIQFENNVHSDVFTEASIPAESEENEDTSNLKEHSIHQLQTLNQEVIRRVDVLEETNTYVVENLEKGEQILREIEESEDVELSRQEIEQLVVCVSITETIITQTEIVEVSKNDHHYENIYTTTSEDEDTIIIKTVKSSVQIHETEEEVIETEFEDSRELSAEDSWQCVSKSNQTFLRRKNKSIQTLPIKDLLVSI